MKLHPYFKNHALSEGKLWVDGAHFFVKTGKPLRDYSDADSIDLLIEDLPTIAAKGYNNLALNCYWHHFNPSGDGQIEVSLDPLRKLIKTIQAHGMYASLSVETYGVGGGQIPAGFWEKHPEDALAVNHLGERVSDTEYGYGSKVPSLFSKAYLDASRLYMKNLVAALGAENFLYFETTVEPQFMGAQWLDYSNEARQAYSEWLGQNTDAAALPFPESLPASETFCKSAAWNTFRAQSLADWINKDSQALKTGAGNADLWIASDYLDAEEHSMPQRCGNPAELLRNMTEVDIIQVNWTWCNITRQPNQNAYDRVRKVMAEHARDWVITEHMTINGSDYFESDMPGLIENTLKNGTHFGWEFVDIAADRDSAETKPNDVFPGDFKPQHFAVYDADWKPKPAMAAFEDNWAYWMEKVAQSTSATVRS
ncbi:MAG: hypothetical protein ABF330_12540 [Lentimonas sp.]